MIHGILGGTRIMNQPSFPQLMARLGPLRLTLGHLSWSDLNDEARRALSIHDFRNIKFEWSAFPSIVDLGDLLSGSAELETLILGRLEIEDASIPLHPRHQRGPSVERLRLHALNAESSIFTTIVDSRVSPVSFDKLRALDVTISNAEELIALQNVLKTSNTLETLTVSHIHYNSHSRPLPRPRLNLKNLLHLNLELHDFHNHMYPIVHTDLFEWWCTVWTKAKVISMKELSIKTSFKSDWNEDYDVTVWAKIAVALSRPVWVLLPKLFITIDASNQEIGQELYRYKDAVQRAMDGSSVDVWIEVDYPQDYYEPDEAMYPGSEEEQEEEDVGYSDLDDW
ncbi:uncharacterized protein EV420DRAFT_1644401 [Desarmillaria tabescens]|uniref:F-box domain-containing protein n=1 Tax=Armillaria tabescens TaxID=1929756 RepID=A0AA39N393_ARMTA|nr:uncharacterized protein EV420DRAFT_1644401 [Desarmillaria tabescens]KAK0455615.1 hypothetical protein EV420DRAFT_1644401 [Desarmillaria tabescens]